MKFVYLLFCFLNSINLFSQEFIIENYNYSGFHNFFLKCDSLKDSFSGRRLIKTQFKNDSIYIYLDYVDGKKIKATGYFKNGKKYRETNYDGRHLNGSDSRYYKDGQIEFRLQYNHGSKIPPMIYWYEDGRIKTISNISEDNNGTSLEFYPNGNIHIIEYFGDTLGDGYEEVVYHENGMLGKKCRFYLGIQKDIEYFDNGQKQREGFILNDQLYMVGEWKEWYVNGIKKREYFFDENTPNMKVGTWLWWDEKGNLIKQEIYKNNELIDIKEFIPINIKKD